MNKPLGERYMTFMGKTYYHEEDVVSALEGLKEDMNDFYHSIGKPKVWAQSNNELCDLCEEHAKKIIDEWFPFASQSIYCIECKKKMVGYTGDAWYNCTCINCMQSGKVRE